MNRRKRYIALSFMAILLILMLGCGKSSSSQSGSASLTNAPASGFDAVTATASGTLSVSLTDAPASGFDAVNVTVSKVRVQQSSTASENDPGWSDITLNPPRKINLLNLANGVLDSLGQTSLPAGHYTQLRLVLSANTGINIANSVVRSGTKTEIPLFTPSGVQSGIKLIHEFDVSAGQHVDLVLDFDALKSVVTRGNGSYGLMPVITVIPTVLTAHPTLITGIEGFIDASILGSNVMISAQVNGTEVGSTAPDAQTGKFFLSHLDAGNYDVVVTADGHATAVISGVPVLSATGTNGATITSTSVSPINLPTSTVHTISGFYMVKSAVTTSAVSSFSAKQTFTAGPTVTVKSQGKDLIFGTYSLSLPAGAPLLGSYGTGIVPILLTPQPGTAGIYAVEASASGCQTQSANEDISAGDVTQNFILSP